MRVLPFLFCAIASVASAADVAPPVIHRLRVCDDPAGARCVARSTNGNFEVVMPFAFNDFEMAAVSKDDVPLATYTVGARSESDTRFAVTATALKSGSIPPLTAQEMIEEFGDRESAKFKTREIAHAGLKGFELSVIEPDREAVLRSLRSECCHYLISVEYPISEAETTRKQMAAFFASLRVMGCPKIVESCVSSSGAPGS